MPRRCAGEAAALSPTAGAGLRCILEVLREKKVVFDHPGFTTSDSLASTTC